MKPVRLSPLCASALVGWFSTLAPAAILDFETPPLSTTFGAGAGNTPGEVVLIQQGIAMSVENFVNTPETFTDFFEAVVGGQFDPAFPTTPLSMESIGAAFDVTGVGFEVNQASFEFIEFGIHYNFSINGGPILEVGSLSELPANLGGVALALEELDAATGRMRLTLTGDVNEFLIAADEIGIDTIVAVPEPATLVLLTVCGAFLIWRGSRRVARGVASH